MRTRDRDVTTGPALAGLVRAVVGLMAALALVACEAGPETGDAAGGVADARESAPADPSGQEASGRESASGGEGRQRINITDLGVNIGDPTAPIQVVEFSDFGCPHCRAFHMETFPDLHEEYVETGKVIWKYVPFVLGTFPNSLAATRAGECAIAQDDFASLRDRIFRNQSEWMNVDDPTDLFVGYARDTGLDLERFRSCLEEGRREDRIRETLSVAREVGVTRTPTFFIQGRVVEGNRPVEFFRQIFDRLLENQQAGQGAEGGS